MKREIGKRIEIEDGNNDTAIQVKNLSKSFKLPTEQAFGLKQAFFNRLRGIKGYKEQKVLKNLDFEIKKGEFIGIVGRNGSGKSTLLKILAGVYYPQKGEITINGSLVPFIELGVGFNPELTGRENVYMNGALLGFSNEEMEKMYDDIWEFAELKDFQDQKLKNYSSGMQVRLAFSIAIRAKGDILLLDEVLAVGDAAFQQKCNDYFTSLKNKKQTVILVTHSMRDVRRFCTRAILLENGKIIENGDPAKIANSYNKLLGIE
ncbi:ABC transporter ATP-binding protein [Candidatus Saccharibacteria bacterium]|nr:ABC transporter ATP-binding protein [Candidatus Saccharibacteria bacterium]